MNLRHRKPGRKIDRSPYRPVVKFHTGATRTPDGTTVDIALFMESFDDTVNPESYRIHMTADEARYLGDALLRHADYQGSVSGWTCHKCGAIMHSSGQECDCGVAE